MDTLHKVMRALQPEQKGNTKSEALREPLTVFREFLAHLDRVTRLPAKPRTKAAPRKPVKRKSRR